MAIVVTQRHLDAIYEEAAIRAANGATAAEQADYLYRAIGGLVEKARKPAHVKDVSGLQDEAADYIARRQANLSDPDFKEPTYPWKTWNDILLPLEPGMVGVLSAEDGAMKSAIMSNYADWLARNGFRVAFVHFELSHRVMGLRQLSTWSSLTYGQLIGRLSGEQLAKIDRVQASIKSWPGEIVYFHTPGMSMQDVLLNVAEKHAEQKFDIVIVDYLNKTSASPEQLREFGSNTFARQANDVELTKTFAEHLEVPIWLVAQQNKDGKDGNASKKNIRGAGETTEKANVVVILQRATDSEGNNTDVLIVTVAKQTVGRLGSFHQRAVPQFFRVDDPA